MIASLNLRAAIVSIGFSVCLPAGVASRHPRFGADPGMDPAYAKLMGATATQGKSPMPGPLEVGAKLVGAIAPAVLR